MENENLFFFNPFSNQLFVHQPKIPSYFLSNFYNQKLLLGLFLFNMVLVLEIKLHITLKFKFLHY